jgi:hypothetical protein
MLSRTLGLWLGEFGSVSNSTSTTNVLSHPSPISSRSNSNHVRVTSGMSSRCWRTSAFVSISNLSPANAVFGPKLLLPGPHGVPQQPAIHSQQLYVFDFIDENEASREASRLVNEGGGFRIEGRLLRKSERGGKRPGNKCDQTGNMGTHAMPLSTGSRRAQEAHKRG